jgi:hypothetical protein
MNSTTPTPTPNPTSTSTSTRSYHDTSNSLKRQLLDTAYQHMNSIYSILSSDITDQQISNIASQLKVVLLSAEKEQDLLSTMKPPAVLTKTKGRPASSKREMIYDEHVEVAAKKKAKTMKAM